MLACILNIHLTYLAHMHIISKFPEFNQCHPPQSSMWSHVQLMFIVKTYFRIRFLFSPHLFNLLYLKKNKFSPATSACNSIFFVEWGYLQFYNRERVGFSGFWDTKSSKTTIGDDIYHLQILLRYFLKPQHCQPIYSGIHSFWITCVRCKIVPYTFITIICITCTQLLFC